MKPTGVRSERMLPSGRGLTIVEVLVAIAMLGVIAAAVVSSFGALAGLNRAGQQDLRVVADARAAVEQLRQWASPAAEFDVILGHPSPNAYVDAYLDTLGLDATCESRSVAPAVGGLAIRLEIECDIAGSSTPAAFLLDVVRVAP